MKKLILPVLIIALLSGCAPKAATGEGKRLIVATTYPIYLLTTALTEGEKDVQVSLLLNQPTSCVHDYTLTVADMKALEGADMVLRNGVGLENFMADALARSKAIIVDCDQGVPLLAAAEGHDHEHQDHDEGEHDPHIWMSPANAAIMAGTIATALESMTGNAAYHDKGLEAQKQLLERGEAWKKELESLKNRGLITFHNGFAYFADYFGLDILKAIEEEAGSEAGAGEIVEVTTLIKEKNLRSIFTERLGSDATAKAIQRETGVKIGQLDMIMNGTGTGLVPYLTAMEANVKAISEALG